MLLFIFYRIKLIFSDRKRNMYLPILFKDQSKLAVLLDFSLLMQAHLYLYIHSLLVASDKKKNYF